MKNRYLKLSDMLEIQSPIDSALIRKQSYGYTIYENSFFSNLDGLTATGFTPTFNNLTGSIVLANGATNNTKYIQVGDYSTADLGKELYVKYKVVDLSGYGLRIGHVWNAGYNLSTNSIDLCLNATVYASMPSAIVAAVGDILELTVTQKGFKYIIKVSINGKDQVFETSTPSSPNGLGFYRIFNVGGNVEINKIRYASNSQRDPYIITLGDSKTAANDYATYLTTLGPTSTHGANGASTADILAYCDRIFTYLKPNYVILNVGRNDIAYGMTLETTEANYKAIVAKCEANGAKVIHLLPLPENTNIDQSSLTAFLKATYTDCVDVSTIWNLATDVYDMIHPSDLGARKMAYSVMSSALIPYSSNYYRPTERINDGSILNISILGNSATTSAVSGTTNYLSKFSSASKLGNSGVFENATGLGIGTTNPQTPLHINKNVPYQLRLENSGQYYDFGRDSSTGFLAIYGNQSGYNGYIFKGVDRTFLTLLNNGNATLLGILTAKNLKSTDLVGTGTRLVAALPDGTLVISSVNYQDLSQKGQANGYASLDAGGKIPNAQIPPLAISETFPVASQAAMLALTAEQGDVAIRSDISKSFILQQSPASTLANWKELLTPTDAVQSVNGKVGVVSLSLQDVCEAGDTFAGILTAKNLKGTDLAGTGTRLVAALSDGTLAISSAIYQDVSLKAQPNGYASLGSDGKIPRSQIPSINTTSPLNWDAATSTLYFGSTTGTGATIVLNNEPTIISAVVGTQPVNDNSGRAASTQYVTRAIANITETDTLQSVTARGSVTNTQLISYNTAGNGIKLGGFIPQPNGFATTSGADGYVDGYLAYIRLEHSFEPSNAFNRLWFDSEFDSDIVFNSNRALNIKTREPVNGNYTNINKIFNDGRIQGKAAANPNEFVTLSQLSGYALTAQPTDYEVTDSAKGIILKDATLGTRHRITLNNGVLEVSAAL